MVNIIGREKKNKYNRKKNNNKNLLLTEYTINQHMEQRNKYSIWKGTIKVQLKVSQFALKVVQLTNSF
jgi:hypothetical protein